MRTFKNVPRWILLLMVVALVQSACALGATGQNTTPPTSNPQTAGNTSAPTQPAAQLPAATAVPLSTATTSPPSPTIAEAQPSGDARQALSDAFSKLANAYPYRMTENNQTAGVTVNIVRDFAAADKYHITWNSTPAGVFSGETITIGSTSYSKSGDQWTVSNEGPSEPDDTLDFVKFLSTLLKDAQAAGSDTLNGAGMYVYGFTLQNQDMTATGKAWIGKADGLPHHVEAQLEVAGQSGQIQLDYEYGAGITVEAPIP
jgi:hypothetical protein